MKIDWSRLVTAGTKATIIALVGVIGVLFMQQGKYSWQINVLSIVTLLSLIWGLATIIGVIEALYRKFTKR